MFRLPNSSCRANGSPQSRAGQSSPIFAVTGHLSSLRSWGAHHFFVNLAVLGSPGAEVGGEVRGVEHGACGGVERAGLAFPPPGLAPLLRLAAHLHRGLGEPSVRHGLGSREKERISYRIGTAVGKAFS